MLKTESLSYFLDNKNFIGHLAYDSANSGRRPAVMVVPTWMGLNAFARAKAEALAELGYIGYALDLFGEATEAKTPEEAQALVTPLLADRQIICTRLQKAVDTLRTYSLVNTTKVAAIGFCFGGMSVLEFAKSGCALSGVVSFHASLPSLPPLEPAEKIPASILILHGYKDALAPEANLLQLQRDLDKRNADWQVITYGAAMHAFTNPKVNLPSKSLQYDEQTATRAWQAMQNFLNELF